MLQRLYTAPMAFHANRPSALKISKAPRFGESVKDSSQKTAYEQLEAARKKGVKHALILGGGLATLLMGFVTGDILLTGSKVRQEMGKQQELEAGNELQTQDIHSHLRARSNAVFRMLEEDRQQEFEKKLEAQRQELLGLKETTTPETEQPQETSQK